MRFKFCGDLDCPDWVLAEIATISKISSIKAKQLCVLVASCMLNKENLQEDRIEKVSADTKLEVNDIRACIALIEFILTSGVKYNASGEIINSELQQLGLPKEHSTALCRVYDENQLKLEEILKTCSLKLNTLDDINWRVDHIFGSSNVEKINERTATLQLKINNIVENRVESHAVTLDATQLKLLIHELKEARKLMEQLESTSQ